MDSTTNHYMNSESRMNSEGQEINNDDMFSPYYRTSKIITVLLCNHILEIMSILCVISCIILLLLCTLILTISLYLTEMVKNNYNKHNLPNLKMVIQVYIATISKQISNYITLSKLMSSANIIIKQEPYSSSNNNEESSVTDIESDDDESEHSDSQSIPSHDIATDNSSDIEDVTEEVLQSRLLNRDIVDLTNDMDMETSSDNDTNSKSRQSSINSDIMNESSNEEEIETKKNN